MYIYEAASKPFTTSGISKEEIQSYKKSIKKINAFFTLYYYKKRLLSKLHLSKSSNAESTQVPYTNTLINPVLYGACYIFSRNYLQNRGFAFNPETFIFFEEEILQFECSKNNLKVLYSPNVKVSHVDDVSTNLAYKKIVSQTI